jgi:4-hydroxy-4-methyl-2-oxoglutarate aldolase
MHAMIAEPPLLTMDRSFPRPTPAELAAFAGVQTGFVVDCMGGRGALHHAVKPLAPPAGLLVGTALTCDCGPADNLAVFGALLAAQPGDVVLAATDGFAATAVVGDLVLGMARNRGVAGFVTDGMVRDVAGILGVGLPCWCAGVTPNSPVRNGPGTVGLPITLAGVPVASGDIVVADGDGVVIVPRRKVPAVIEALAGVKAAEAALDARVRAGLAVPEWLETLAASGRIAGWS